MINVNRSTLFALVLAVTAFLYGCTGMGPGYEKPTVSVQSFRSLESAGGGMPRFEIVLHVINPNREPLELAGIAYTISIDGHEVIRGVGNELPVIEGYGEGTYTLTAGFDLLEGMQLFHSLMDMSSDRFDYAFEATLDPGGFGRKIRITDSGSISLSGAAGRGG